MEQEQDSKRMDLIFEMLLAMAVGNFNMSIPLGDHDDELETLVVLVNMVAEELGESVFHLGYVNPRRTYSFMAQAMVNLSLAGQVRTSSKELCTLLGYSKDELHGLPLTHFLSPATVKLFEHVMVSLNKPDVSQEALRLEWISKKGLYVPAHCSLVKFEEASTLVLSFIIPCMPELETDLHVSDALIKQRLERQMDARLIQEVYDYILGNSEVPFPSLKVLSRKFGTNEFKLKTSFSQFFNTSVYQFYMDERLKRAHLMIAQRDLPLKEIAFLVGFSSYPHFSKSFKKKYGYNPVDLQLKNPMLTD